MLARPERLDPGWARANIERVWRAQAKKRTLKAYEAQGGAELLDELALATRDGLPDPLRVLVEKYPRPKWEGHPHFTELTRFWLDMHLGFRRMQGLLDDGDAGVSRPVARAADYAGGLARVASQYLNGLHGHHNIEDHHYFPMLKALDARIAWGFDLLDADHQAMDGAIHELAEATNAVLAAVRDPRRRRRRRRCCGSGSPGSGG